MTEDLSNNVPRDGALVFWLESLDGRSYRLDLTEFAEGGKRENVVPRAQPSWSGDYQGRPGFASGLADVFLATRPPESSQASIRTSCRQLMRFLDLIDPDQTIRSFDDLKDSHGVELMRWTTANGSGSSVYKKIKGLVDAARLASECTPLFWPAGQRDAIVHKDDIDMRGFQRLYTALKKEAMSIKDMFRQGHRLAEAGCDPRGLQSKWGSAEWEKRENHAWLVNELTRDTLPYKYEFYAAGAQGLNKANCPETQKHDGPEYLAPGMTERGREGIVGKLRWFHPSYQDTAIFFWLFQIGIGWNLSTGVVMDVSEERAWCEIHPQNPAFRVIHSFKGRADRHQFAPSLVKPEWHPYRIIDFMIERTAPLRRTVIHRLTEARGRHEAAGTPESAAEVQRLEEMSRSPWLYHVVNKVGEIGCLTSDDCYHLNTIVRLVVEKHGLATEHPTLTAMMTSETRDAWIGHAYIASNNNMFIARLAGQHADYRSLINYLRRRRYRAQSENLVRRFQNTAFDEIESGRILDPTRIRLMLERGQITPEEETRLLDLRQRTRLGMGCLTPRSPPRKVSPDHVPGTICRPQRCTGCSSGIVFKESLDSLARGRAELTFIHRTMPLVAWSGSSFEEEAASLDATLAHFDLSDVEEAVNRWLNKFISGEIQVHDTFPVY